MEFHDVDLALRTYEATFGEPFPTIGFQGDIEKTCWDCIDNNEPYSMDVDDDIDI